MAHGYEDLTLYEGNNLEDWAKVLLTKAWRIEGDVDAVWDDFTQSNKDLWMRAAQVVADASVNERSLRHENEKSLKEAHNKILSIENAYNDLLAAFQMVDDTVSSFASDRKSVWDAIGPYIGDPSQYKSLPDAVEAALNRVNEAPKQPEGLKVAEKIEVKGCGQPRKAKCGKAKATKTKTK